MIDRNPKTSLPHDAQLALRIMRDHITSRQLATVLAHPLFEITPEAPIDGFAAASRGGVSLFFVDATDAEQTGQWSVQLCAGIAIDCHNVDRALRWTNARNRKSAVDRYFCAITADESMCAIAADTAMSSILLDGFAQPLNRPVVVTLKSLVQNTMYTADEDGAELAQTFDGRQLTTSDQDLITLFQIASG